MATTRYPAGYPTRYPAYSASNPGNESGSGTVVATRVFLDTFTDTGGTTLPSHTPDQNDMSANDWEQVSTQLMCTIVNNTATGSTSYRYSELNFTSSYKNSAVVFDFDWQYTDTYTNFFAFGTTQDQFLDIGSRRFYFDTTGNTLDIYETIAGPALNLLASATPTLTGSYREYIVINTDTSMDVYLDRNSTPILAGTTAAAMTGTYFYMALQANTGVDDLMVYDTTTLGEIPA